MTGRIMALAACVLIAVPAVRSGEATEPRPLQRPFEEFPRVIGEWAERATPPFDPRVVARLGVDDHLNHAYTTADGAVALLYIGYYASQHTGHRVHYPMSCLPGQGWQPIDVATVSLDTGGPAGRVSLNRYVVQKGLDQHVMFFWYQSHGRLVANEYLSKLYLASDAMFLNRSDTALVRVIAPVRSMQPDGVLDAAADGMRFVKAALPTIARYLPQ
jgi:EpsI family protein